MRRKSLWPRNTMPNKSKTSRSYQFADGNKVVIVQKCELSSTSKENKKRILYAMENKL